METLDDDQHIIGVAKFKILTEFKKGIVNNLHVIGSPQVKQLILKKFLMNIEEISKNSHLSTVVVEIADYKTDHQNILLSNGYSDQAGYMDKNDNKTFIIEFHKNINEKHTTINIDNENVFNINENSKNINNNSDNKNTMDSEILKNTYCENTQQPNDFPVNLIESLFSALHKQYDDTDKVDFDLS